jgi:hypothetical protein
MRINRTRSLRALGLLGLALAIGNPALAANVHLKGGKKAEPTFTDTGLALSVRGGIAGLGNEDIAVNLSATGNVDASCVNPGSGNHEPPGQNPAPVTLTGVQPIPEEEFKNGQVAFNVSTNEPVSPIPGAPDCPNPNWSEVINDIAFTSATITVEQPVGTVVLTVSCTFSEPTSDGQVPKSEVTCTSI